MTDMKPSAQLRRFLGAPLWFILILIAFCVGIFRIDRRAGFLALAGVIVYSVAQLIAYQMRKRRVIGEMVRFASEFGRTQNELFSDFSLPCAIIDRAGRIFWTDPAFEEMTDAVSGDWKRTLTTIFPEIEDLPLPDGDEVEEMPLTYGDRYFAAKFKRIDASKLAEEFSLFEEPEAGAAMYAVFLQDETELHNYIQKYRDEAIAGGLIYIDNYDEALETVEEVRKSLLTALIERRITKYFRDIGGVVRKFERDKFFVVMQNRSLNELMERHFDILEGVKTVNIGNDMEITISIGIGANCGGMEENFNASRTAIDLALGRGGDQAVVKNGATNRFYGGKKEAVEKNTRVKARVKAHALKEFMSAKDKVVIMGHQLIDADAFGAAIGIYRAARTMNKKACIVIDRVTSSMRPLIDLFREEQDFAQNVFLDVEQAEETVGRDTLVVVVDTSKPSYTSCPAILKKTDAIIVIDHHRQGNESINNAVLSYIEPYASSACEMVAEILQYFSDDVRIHNAEADAMYAGMMVDTDNFMQKTGVRTFEAAAYLRRSGADVTRVRKLFREDMNDYRARGETISNAIQYRDRFAISICPADRVESPTIVASQSANALLNIIGVRASFVLTEYDDRIYISARAIDEVNVQIIMERLGGGGHMNMAGCQLSDMTVTEAVEKLKATLDAMIEEGEI